MKALSLTLLCLIHILASAQEKNVPLRFNAAQAARYANEQRMSSNNERGGGGVLALPFFDDFSKYSLATSDPTIPVNDQRWSDNNAFINCTLPVSPLTIGVATLDGLQANGQPYVWDEDNIVQECDVLTSLPIDLSNNTPVDTLRLLFHYQNGGIGDVAESYDTLYLDFFTPINGGNWFNVWKVAGGNPTNNFQQEFVEILDDIYFNTQFKFRFRNYGRPGGLVDLWHLDYIVLADEIDPDAFQFDEVAFQYCNNTLLEQGYTAMPWTHFTSNPNGFMANNITVSQRNLGGVENVTSRVEILQGSNVVFTSAFDPNTAQGQGEYTRTISLQDYVYDDPSALTETSFDVRASFNQTDARLSNDTMQFTQNFSNYYAYDDGSAESGYGINTGGGRVAMRFESVVPDTLLGVMVHWVPFIYDHSDETFLLRIYDVAGNIPGTELNEEDFQFYSPNYSYDGFNSYYYYELTDPIALDGPFFVGWIQQASTEIYIGNDMNTGMNATKLFYKYDAFSNWSPSTIGGSIMLRPVFKNSMNDWTNVDEAKQNMFSVFPNPTNDDLKINMPANNSAYQIQITDIAGRMVLNQTMMNDGNMNISMSALNNGVYVLKLTNADNNTTQSIRIIKQ
jgi:Secretion system C-terminal sorting domain